MRVGNVDFSHWQPVRMSGLLFLVWSLEAGRDVVHLERAHRRAAQTVSVNTARQNDNNNIKGHGMEVHNGCLPGYHQL